MPILNDIIVLNTVGPRTWLPLLSYVSTKPIKFASCARIFGLSLLLDFTDPSFILKRDLYMKLLLFLCSTRTLALPLVFHLVLPFFFYSLALNFLSPAPFFVRTQHLRYVLHFVLPLFIQGG